jgi:AraC-like DNA-binding protein
MTGTRNSEPSVEPPPPAALVDRNLGAQVSYQEAPVVPELSRAVVCTWTLTIAGTDAHVQRVLPDGCADIVWFGESDPVVVGPMTGHSLTSLAPGTSLFGIRFRPGWALPLFGVRADDLADQQVPLHDVWSSSSADQLTEHVRRGPSLAGKPTLTGRSLGSLLEVRRAPDPAVVQAIHWLAEYPGARVQRVAEQLGMSSRQFQRRFVSAVGYGPKLFHRILRFQRLLARAEQVGSQQTAFAALAAALGYADQAHMTREVTQLSGVTPRALLGRTSSALAMSELFKTPLD